MKLVCVVLASVAGCTVADRPADPEPPDANDCVAPDAGTPRVYATASLLIPGVAWKEHLAVFDPITLEVSEWISLDSCNDGMIDMAVDANGSILLAGANGYYWFDPISHACLTIKRSEPDASDPFLSHMVAPPNNITFAPAALFGASPNPETLVGFGLRLVDDTDWQTAEAGYLAIDPTTAQTTIVRPWSAGDQFAPSGDIVTVTDMCRNTTRAWATVIGPKETSTCHACEGNQVVGVDCGDCLYEFALSDGSFQQNLGLLPYQGVFGLTFWGGVLVGFTYDGKVIQIDPAHSPPTTTEITIPIPEGFTQIAFTGAGSTTIAPTLF